MEWRKCPLLCHWLQAWQFTEKHHRRDEDRLTSRQKKPHHRDAAAQQYPVESTYSRHINLRLSRLPGMVPTHSMYSWLLRENYRSF